MSKLSFTKIYLTDWLAWRRIISEERLCQIIDSVADYCQFAQQTFQPQNDAEKQIYETMLKWADESRAVSDSAREKQRKSAEARRLKKESKSPDNLPSKLPSKSHSKPSGNLPSTLQPEPEPEPELKLNDNPPTGETRARTIKAADVIERWNKIATLFKRPQIRTLCNDQKIKFAARLQEHGLTPDEFFDICHSAISKDDAMRNGVVKNDGTTWGGANFDYFLRPQNFRRAREIAENIQQTPPPKAKVQVNDVESAKAYAEFLQEKKGGAK